MNKSPNKIPSFTSSMLLGEQLLNEGKILKITAGGFSMFPAIRKGDIVYIRNINKKNLKRGDVVVFKTNLKFIAHRLIKTKSTEQTITFFCKGDSMLKADKPINYTQLVGKITHIKRNNKTIDLECKKAKAKLRATISPLTGFLFWIGWKFYFRFKRIFLNY